MLTLGACFRLNPQNETANRQKHGVTFADACTVFSDSLARIFPDDAHSSNEGSLLIVSFTERRRDWVRIISARNATRMEKKDYEEDLG